jgi:mono/diheme cytochrome c family protein
MREAIRRSSVALLAALALGWLPAPPARAQATAAAGSERATADTDLAQAGRRLYGQNCSHCHGFNMVNPGTVSYDLRKFPLEDPDRFFHSVREGKGSMPAWKNSLTSEQIAKIWAYVQTRGTP